MVRRIYEYLKEDGSVDIFHIVGEDDKKMDLRVRAVMRGLQAQRYTLRKTVAAGVDNGKH